MCSGLSLQVQVKLSYLLHQLHPRVAEIAGGQGVAGARLPLHAALAGGRRIREVIDEQRVATNGAVSAVSNTVINDGYPGRLDRGNADGIYRRAVH